MQEKERNQQLSVQSVMITFIFYLNVTDPLPLIFIFYLIMKRLMVTTNFAMKIKDLGVNHKSQPVKLKTGIYQFVADSCK